VRQQTVLRLKVTTAHPASLVRLVSGAEVAVAPRPRRALTHQNVLKDTDVNHAAASAQPGAEETAADTWLRLQV